MRAGGGWPDIGRCAKPAGYRHPTGSVRWTFRQWRILLPMSCEIARAFATGTDDGRGKNRSLMTGCARDARRGDHGLPLNEAGCRSRAVRGNVSCSRFIEAMRWRGGMLKMRTVPCTVAARGRTCLRDQALAVCAMPRRRKGRLRAPVFEHCANGAAGVGLTLLRCWR